ncbi:response regulator [Magnetospirillum aberrantis]|uniref:Response regulator n=1 Tax=Magnetospirillum aberrantis SpK TaxID=908842 RepID=A0A7C9QRN5_9PROT|nr:response regulator [Magnetospirillum aberrantis]NFV78958.1 response regulator [Magnetospirillum aberrantis SpK]
MLARFHRNDLHAVVVEDDDTTRALLLRLLTNMGAEEVWGASDGAEGLRLVCQKRPSLVLCDLEMDPVDGLSLLGGVRSAMDPLLAATPVFIFTGNKDAHLLSKAKTLKAAGYLVKPFNPKGFSSYLAEAMAVRDKTRAQSDSEGEPDLVFS